MKWETKTYCPIQDSTEIFNPVRGSRREKCWETMIYVLDILKQLRYNTFVWSRYFKMDGLNTHTNLAAIFSILCKCDTTKIGSTL